MAWFTWFRFWNLINNVIHIYKKGWEAYPFQAIKDWWNRPSGYVPNVVYDYEFFVGRKQYPEPAEFYNYDNDELPF